MNMPAVRNPGLTAVEPSPDASGLVVEEIEHIELASAESYPDASGLEVEEIEHVELHDEAPAK